MNFYGEIRYFMQWWVLFLQGKITHFSIFLVTFLSCLDEIFVIEQSFEGDDLCFLFLRQILDASRQLSDVNVILQTFKER